MSIKDCFIVFQKCVVFGLSNLDFAYINALLLVGNLQTLRQSMKGRKMLLAAAQINLQMLGLI